MEKGLNKEIISKYTLGDMLAVYIKDENQGVELLLIPADKESVLDSYEFKISRGDSLIQVKLLGDMYPGTLSGGTTMRNSETTEMLHYVNQKQEKTLWKPTANSTESIPRTEIKTYLSDGRGHTYIHTLGYTEGDYSLDSYTEFVNEADETATLEQLSSFSLSELTPFVSGEAIESMQVHRIRSKWSHEGKLVTESLEDLQLEMSWVGWHVNSVRYGSIGSMPVKKYSPFGVIEDKVNGIAWGAQLMIETSWEMEFYRRDEALAFSGGLADREYGAWSKAIKPGESFRTPTAILTVCTLSEDKESLVDLASQRMTHYVNKFVNCGPESEQHLPILFNEYCTTWGLPSYENIDGILKAISGHGLEYFVIDCGWFVEEGKSWGDGMGDYIPSDILFPEGLGKMADRIREEGLKPGIWFEIDNVGKDAHLFEDKELLHTRDGITLTTKSRRFLDMRMPEVIEYLDEKVIGQLNKYGFEYMKMDYNDTIGLGVDSYNEAGELDPTVSLGEGLRADREASVDFVNRVKEKVPGIILENCASGGHKLEPLMMSICSMASFSDAHECEHIPSIAGGLARTILPRQSQIWAVIRKEADLTRIGWVLASTLLGRMCFSGDVTELSEAQWQAIDAGIDFYKSAASIIKNGYTHIYDNKGASDRKLTGWQGYVREQTKENTLSTEGSNKALVTVFIYDNSENMTLELPRNCGSKITKTYATTDIKATISNDKLTVTPGTGKMEAIALIVER